MIARFVRLVAGLALAAPVSLSAQMLEVGGSVTPYAGYLITGRYLDGPFGTNVAMVNTPMIGAQMAIPLVSGLSLTGNVGYASADVRVGVPVIGGINVGTNNLWVYDAGLELGGLAKGRRGLAPFVQAGVGGMTDNMRSSFLSLQSTNLVYTAGVGIDVGLSRLVGVRVHAKDYIGRFDTEEAIGIGTRGNLAHHWALSAGLKLAF